MNVTNELKYSPKPVYFLSNFYSDNARHKKLYSKEPEFEIDFTKTCLYLYYLSSLSLL